ncbi:MAG: Flp pilus assembly complex ATPase component TadA [Myxococcales bacterium]|nr:Flp pilus assembly complex ATPase component TadA [Myxococcales bacterium]
MSARVEREALVLPRSWGRERRLYWHDVERLDGRRLYCRDEALTLDAASCAPVGEVLADRARDGDAAADPGALRDRLLAVDAAPGYWPARWLGVLLRHAVALECSDVHLGVRQEHVEVELRRHGTIMPLLALPSSRHAPLVGAAKSMAGLRSYVHDIVQEGRLRLAEVDVDVRVSVLPTVAGERLAFRLPDPRVRSLALTDLGFDPEERSALEAVLRRRSGLFLVTGPSGVGKTTTLYAALRHVMLEDGGRSRVATVEDPPEALLPGVTQVRLNPGDGLDMDVALAHLLRQDVDVIAVGEIRDRATARAAVGAALTGHLVLATLHCGSATEAVHRLRELDVPADRLAHALLGVMAQRLTRLRCAACGVNGLGVATCPRCLGTGFDGRSAIAELLLLGEADRSAVAEGRPPAEPTRRLAERANERVQRGLTSAAEATACAR